AASQSVLGDLLPPFVQSNLAALGSLHQVVLSGATDVNIRDTLDRCSDEGAATLLDTEARLVYSSAHSLSSRLHHARSVLAKMWSQAKALMKVMARGKSGLGTSAERELVEGSFQILRRVTALRHRMAYFIDIMAQHVLFRMASCLDVVASELTEHPQRYPSIDHVISLHRLVLTQLERVLLLNDEAAIAEPFEMILEACQRITSSVLEISIPVSAFYAPRARGDDVPPPDDWSMLCMQIDHTHV
ncbi:hypothetical protein KIPB_011563, partial [Kipferlia bialata]